IRNIYHLLCYAWERLEARDALHLSAAPSERAEDLLAHVLREGVARLLKRGLDRGYVPHVAEERRLRGKLLLRPTLKRGALTRGSGVCETDSFTAEVLHDQLIKAAMRALMGAPRLDEPLRQALRVHCLRMGEVSDVPLTLAQFRGVQLHRNNAIYGFLLDVAHLVASCMVPDEASGVRSF